MSLSVLLLLLMLSVTSHSLQWDNTTLGHSNVTADDDPVDNRLTPTTNEMGTTAPHRTSNAYKISNGTSKPIANTTSSIKQTTTTNPMANQSTNPSGKPKKQQKEPSTTETIDNSHDDHYSIDVIDIEDQTTNTSSTIEHDVTTQLFTNVQTISTNNLSTLVPQTVPTTTTATKTSSTDITTITTSPETTTTSPITRMSPKAVTEAIETTTEAFSPCPKISDVWSHHNNEDLFICWTMEGNWSRSDANYSVQISTRNIFPTVIPAYEDNCETFAFAIDEHVDFCVNVTWRHCSISKCSNTTFKPADETTNKTTATTIQPPDETITTTQQPEGDGGGSEEDDHGGRGLAVALVVIPVLVFGPILAFIIIKWRKHRNTGSCCRHRAYAHEANASTSSVEGANASQRMRDGARVTVRYVRPNHTVTY